MSTGGAAAGNTPQPIQWSSEFYDSELALVYYNYRHYNPVDGRWIGRDVAYSPNLYELKSPVIFFDIIGAKHKEINTLADIKAITFDDFLGVVPDIYTDSKYHAYMSHTYKFEPLTYVCDSDYMKIEPLEFKLVMRQDKSWHNTKQLSKKKKDELLLHELGHLVIPLEEMNAFKNMKLHENTMIKLPNKDSMTIIEAKKSLHNIVDRHYEVLKNRVKVLENDYDKDTNHSYNKKKQKEYNIKFGLIDAPIPEPIDATPSPVLTPNISSEQTTAKSKKKKQKKGKKKK